MSISKNNLSFLKALKANNNREWFAEQKPRYEEMKKEADLFFKQLQDGLNQHDEIEKHKRFRIYRDVRFSKDKTPYNPHWAGSFSRLGADKRGGYYLRIRPGESFLAGGFWAPNKEDLFRIRKEFEFDPEPIRKIMSAKEFKAVFNGVLTGEELKTAPKGFDKEDPAIDLIRKKGFVAVRSFSDKEVLSKDFENEIDRSYKALRPFFDYMSEVLTTDLNGASLLSD